MRQHKQTILVTRPLDGQQREYARILGLKPIERPALEFEFPPYWDEALAAIADNRRAAWVFTSSNAVKALQQMMQNGLQAMPETPIFAVGHKTEQALNDLGLEAKVPFRQNSKHLAQLMIDEGVRSAIYFHGNISRDEMTEMLIEENIDVIEVEVYKTHINPVQLPTETVEAILFYSPSAVEGFKNGQGFDDGLPPLFAIGPTTAEALEQETNQKVFVADRPDTKVLLQAVSTYLFREEKVE